jgi:hypothetical protein
MTDANHLHASCTAFQLDSFRDANAILIPLTQVFPFRNFLSLSSNPGQGKNIKTKFFAFFTVPALVIYISGELFCTKGI